VRIVLDDGKAAVDATIESLEGNATEEGEEA
jgi:hypothetical protein